MVCQHVGGQTLGQFGVAADAFGIELPKQREMFANRNVGDGTSLLDAGTIGSEVFLPMLEGPAGTIDGLEVTDVAVQDERLPSGKVVEEPAPPHHMLQFVLRQALVKHCEVIAEVEKRLHRIAFRQRAST